jgi:hypothetical protein
MTYCLVQDDRVDNEDILYPSYEAMYEDLSRDFSQNEIDTIDYILIDEIDLDFFTDNNTIDLANDVVIGLRSVL